MGEKSLGQIAFEAYRADVNGVAYDGREIPEWENLSGNGDATRAAWDAAANAVVSAVAIQHGVLVRVDGITNAPEGHREVPG